MGAVLIAVVALLAFSHASPLPHRLKYDQKQEGKWNVRADLENFIILVIPTSSPGSSSVANTSLLDFLSKTIPLPYHKFPKKHVKIHHHEDENLPDTEQFIESKTAPYHVDISRTRSHLAKLHPEVNIPESIKEEIIIARSPSVALSKSQEIPLPHSRGHKENSLRTSRAILITVPVENENVQMHDIKGVIGKMGENSKKKLSMSAEVIEQGLAEQYQNAPVQKFEDGVQISEPVENLKDNEDSKNSSAQYEKLTQEVRTAYAKLIAKALQNNLVEYFKKVTQKLKEQQAAEEESDEDDPNDLPEKINKDKREEKEKKIGSKDSSAYGSFGQKVVKVYEKLKEKVETKKSPTVNIPPLELEPPKMEAEEMKKKGSLETKVESMEKPNKKPGSGNKEGPKDELLLLGASEQCGPGRERDPSGVCVASKL